MSVFHGLCQLTHNIDPITETFQRGKCVCLCVSPFPCLTRNRKSGTAHRALLLQPSRVVGRMENTRDLMWISQMGGKELPAMPSSKVDLMKSILMNLLLYKQCSMSWLWWIRIWCKTVRGWGMYSLSWAEGDWTVLLLGQTGSKVRVQGSGDHAVQPVFQVLLCHHLLCYRCLGRYSHLLLLNLLLGLLCLLLLKLLLWNKLLPLLLRNKLLPLL